MKERIVFFGTPDFAVPALEALVRAGYNIVAVITQPDKPVGRGLKVEAPPVKGRAQELGLKVLQPVTLKDSPSQSQRTVLDQLKTLQPDLGVAVAYGKIIPKAMLDIFPRGILNVHPSLLPKYRGPSPIQAAILNGDTETGVSIMLLDEEMDHGSILAHHTVSLKDQGKNAITKLGPIGPNFVALTGGVLSKKLAEIGAELLIETLPKYLAGEIKPQPQEHSKATYTKLLTREDGRIDWKKSAEYIERMVRAYDLWPGTWIIWDNHRLKILRATLLYPDGGRAPNATPGYVWKTDDGRLAVNCNPGSVILEELQMEGKRSIKDKEFLRGHPKIVGSLLT